MGGVIGDLLPMAIGVAISPVPIIAVILMLLSQRPGATSIAFGIGWVLGIAVAATVFLLLSGVADLGSDTGPSTTASWIKIVLGALLLVLAGGQWRKRPRPGAEPQLPKWMSAITEFSAVKAGGLGFLLAAVNPKNLLMAVGAGTIIGSVNLSGGKDVIAVVVFTVLAASSVLVPVIGFAVASTKVRPWLDDLRVWLETNNAAVMTVLLLVLGVVMVGKGIAGLG
jgi:hypothetical protein